MDLFSILIIVLGLSLFEVICSIDNAIINAEVLSTMSPKGRKWFLLWGLIFAVFVVRGVLPWLIVWFTVPGLGPIEAFTAAFSSDPVVHEAVESAAPILMMGGGVFLLFLFFHWLYLEQKNFGIFFEKHFQKRGIWFYTVISMLLLGIVWFALKKSGALAFSAMIGSTAFFITHGLKQSAEEGERNLKEKVMSDLSKIMYLEVIDMTFSIDGVLGAFAFTMSVPIILLGNGLGAVIVRQLTIGNIDRIKRYRYLKNGAMYSILALGTVMVLHGFGIALPTWVSPVLTFGVIGFFFLKSIQANKKETQGSNV